MDISRLTEIDPCTWSFAADPHEGRREARLYGTRELVDQLGEQGIIIRTRSMRGAAEEAPGAYKDVEAVAEATERAGLARRVASLRPLICVKG